MRHILNFLTFLITGSTTSEKEAKQMLAALDELAEDMLQFSNAPNTQRNIRSREKRYLQFCSTTKIPPFPVTEETLIRYALYLSFSLQMVYSIKMFCATVCDLHEIRGHLPVVKTKRYYKTNNGHKTYIAT